MPSNADLNHVLNSDPDSAVLPAGLYPEDRFEWDAHTRLLAMQTRIAFAAAIEVRPIESMGQPSPDQSSGRRLAILAVQNIGAAECFDGSIGFIIRR
jgi:hypothetical protein